MSLRIQRVTCNVRSQAIESPKPPPVLSKHFDQDMYEKTQSYSLEKWQVTVQCFLIHPLGFEWYIITI